MKGRFELASWFHAPGSREALKAGTGTVTYVPNMLHRAATDRIQARTARHLLRHLHAARPARLRLPLARHHLREGRHRGGPKTVVLEVNPRLPRTFGDTHLHVSAVDRFVDERPGGAHPPRALPLGHGPRHRRPRRRAGGGRLDDPARHRRHPQRRRPRPAGQARPRGAHRDDGRLRDGALRDGRGHQRAQGPDEGEDHLHLRHGIPGALRLARRQRDRAVRARTVGERPRRGPAELAAWCRSTPA